MSDKTGWEGRDQSRGTQVGAHGALSRALGPAKENNYALEPLDGYIVHGCSGAKTEIPVHNSSLPSKMISHQNKIPEISQDSTMYDQSISRFAFYILGSQSVLSGFGFTMIQIGEYFVAVILWVTHISLLKLA